MSQFSFAVSKTILILKNAPKVYFHLSILRKHTILWNPFNGLLCKKKNSSPNPKQKIQFCIFLGIYAVLLRDKKYGLTVNQMATRVMPALLPQTVNPSLNLEQFTMLLQVLREMLEQIDR